MKKITANTYSEVYCYLNSLGEEFTKKIPSDVHEKIIRMKNSEYNPEYNFEDFKDKTKISKEAQAMIMVLHYKYWCEDKEEKKGIINILKENERKFIEECEPFKEVRKQPIEKQDKKEVELVLQEKGRIKKIFKKMINRIKVFLHIS